MQVAQGSAPLINIGCPVDSAGNSMDDNSYSPGLTDFVLLVAGTVTPLDSGGSVSTDGNGYVYWQADSADTDAPGPMQIQCADGTGSYLMPPFEIQVGPYATPVHQVNF